MERDNFIVAVLLALAGILGFLAGNNEAGFLGIIGGILMNILDVLQRIEKR